MKNIFKYLFLIAITFFSFSCASDNEDDCTKTITIPQYYIVYNQTYSYDTTQEVPCDFPEPEDPELIQPPLLENFTYDVLSFNFTPDTGNNTNRLEFEIKLNNPNNYAVNGIPYITLNADGIVSSTGYNTCSQINASSSCILTYDVEGSLNLGIINSVELVTVEYFLTN